MLRLVYHRLECALQTGAAAPVCKAVGGKDLCGHPVVQRLVWAFKIVEADVVCQLVISLLWAGIVMQINFLVFEGAPQSFREDVVASASTAIHADLDLFTLQAFQVFRAGKVATLIAIPDLRLGLKQGVVDNG